MISLERDDSESRGGEERDRGSLDDGGSGLVVEGERAGRACNEWGLPEPGTMGRNERET